MSSAASARVVDETGEDVTSKFMKGAAETLKTALLTGAQEAYLKDRSPSCGVSLICRRGERIKGMGVTAAMLMKEGIKVTGF